jgi:hypothetical protein
MTSEAENALEDLNLEEDGLSDEYDFMDDAEDGGAAQRGSRETRRQPKQKYMQMLQDVADRKRANIVIELDDLKIARSLSVQCAIRVLMRFDSMRMRSKTLARIRSALLRPSKRTPTITSRPSHAQ